MLGEQGLQATSTAAVPTDRSIIPIAGIRNPAAIRLVLSILKQRLPQLPLPSEGCTEFVSDRKGQTDEAIAKSGGEVDLFCQRPLQVLGGLEAGLGGVAHDVLLQFRL